MAQKILGEQPKPRILVLVDDENLESKTIGELDLRKELEALPGTKRIVADLNQVSLDEWDALLSLTGYLPSGARSLMCFCDNFRGGWSVPYKSATLAGSHLGHPDYNGDGRAAALRQVLETHIAAALEEVSRPIVIKSRPMFGHHAPSAGQDLDLTPILQAPTGEVLVGVLESTTADSDAFESIVVAGEVANPFDWLAACLVLWGRQDPERFPIDNWTHDQQWMSAAERQAHTSLIRAEQVQAESIKRLQQEVDDAQSVLDTERGVAESGVRRLLTSHNDDLVLAVKTALESLGFAVKDQDEVNEKAGLPRLEDLRVNLVASGDSTADVSDVLVEVKGKKRAASGNEVTGALRRPQVAYVKEHQSDPLLWFVVNSEREKAPNDRHLPLHSSPDDVTSFAGSGGLLIWSLDLFRLVRAVEEGRITETDARRLFVGKTGRFVFDESDSAASLR